MRKLLLALVFVLVSTQANALATGWFKDQRCSLAIADADLSLYVAAYFCIDNSATLNAFSQTLAVQGWTLDIIRAGDIIQGAAGACVVEVWMPFKAAGAAVSSSTGVPQLKGDANGDGIEDAAYTLDGTVSKGALREFLAPSLSFKITTKPLAGEQCVIAVLGRR